MAKRVNPTLNEYQERILVGKAHLHSIDPAILVKTAIGEMIERMADSERKLYQNHYDGMTAEEKLHPTK